MFTVRIAATLLSLLSLGTCLAADPPPKIDPMFPDGTVHDFGKLPRGTQAYHAFRIVNTHNVPLRILSLRRS